MGCSQGKASKEVADQPGNGTYTAPDLPPMQLTQEHKEAAKSPLKKGGSASSYAHVAREQEGADITGTSGNIAQPFDQFWLGMHTTHGVNLAALAQNPSFVKINQDRAMTVWPFNGSYGQALIGLFDGHGEGGEHAAEACCHHMPKILMEELAAHDVKTSLINCCAKTDEILLEKSEDAFFFAGTTATLIYMSKSQGPGSHTTIWIAGAGDSRCVRGLFLGGRVISTAMTVDHKASIPAEAQRLMAAGSKIVEGKMYIELDDGFACLDMSRSIGDGLCKQYGVTPEPEVNEIDLASDMVDGTQFLVVASDGLWDVISSQQTCEIVAESNGAKDACNKLVAAALEAWKEKNRFYRDDITVVVAFLPLLHPEWDEKEQLSPDDAPEAAAAYSAAAPPAAAPPSVATGNERRSSVSSVANQHMRAPRRLSAKPGDVPALGSPPVDNGEESRKTHVAAQINMGGGGITAMEKDELPAELRHFADTNMDDAPESLATSFVKKKKKDSGYPTA